MGVGDEFVELVIPACSSCNIEGRGNLGNNNKLNPISSFRHPTHHKDAHTTTTTTTLKGLQAT